MHKKESLLALSLKYRYQKSYGIHRIPCLWQSATEINCQTSFLRYAPWHIFFWKCTTLISHDHFYSEKNVERM